MPDTYVQLPDGSYVQVPPNATPGELQQFKIKLAGMQSGAKPIADNSSLSAPPQSGPITNPVDLGAAMADKIRNYATQAQNLTQEGQKAQPVKAALGKAAGFLFGGSQGIGTSQEGILTNPLLSALAPGAGGEPALAGSIRAGAQVVKGGANYAKALASGLRTPEGDLSPWVKALTHPQKLAEGILDAVIPHKPTFPGAPLPSADEFYQNLADMKMARDKAQASVEVAARRAARNAPTNPFQDMTSSAQPIGNASLPNAPTSPQRPVDFVNQFEKPSPSRIVSPGSPPPDIKTTYQSIPRDQLFEMAKRGDVLAGKELLRNPAGFSLPPNFKYMIEQADRMPWRSYKR